MVAAQLKHIFDNFDKDSSIEKAKEKLQCFINKWMPRYPRIIATLEGDVMDYYFSYIKFPCQVRRLIYTTNAIENLNKQIRKASKNKQSFEKANRMLNYLFIVIQDLEQNNFMRFPVHAFSSCTQDRHNQFDDPHTFVSLSIRTVYYLFVICSLINLMK